MIKIVNTQNDIAWLYPDKITAFLAPSIMNPATTNHCIFYQGLVQPFVVPKEEFYRVLSLVLKEGVEDEPSRLT